MVGMVAPPARDPWSAYLLLLFSPHHRVCAIIMLHITHLTKMVWQGLIAVGLVEFIFSNSIFIQLV
jgi:hypothetical protein